MRLFLSFLLCFFSIGSLAAEIIGNIEYSVPENWKLKNQVESTEKHLAAFFYHPENGPASDIFVAVKSKPKEDLNIDIKSLEHQFQIKHSNQKASFEVLKSSPNSAFYEWSFTDGEQHRNFGWTYIFLTSKDTIEFRFSSKHIDNLEKQRLLWIPILSKLQENPTSAF